MNSQMTAQLRDTGRRAVPGERGGMRGIGRCHGKCRGLISQVSCIMHVLANLLVPEVHLRIL